MAIKLERVVKTYYETLEQGKVLGRKCPKCGNVEWPPVYACNACGSYETEWCEMSGRGTIVELYMPSQLTAKPGYKPYEPYAYAWVKCEEGPERNVMVRNVTRKNAEWIRAHLPYPVHMEIVQCDGFKTAVFAIDPVDENGNPVEETKGETAAAGAPAPQPVSEAEQEASAPQFSEDTLNRLIALVAESYSRDAAELNAQTRFETDLKAPSVIFVGLAAKLEDEFDVMVNITDASAAKTIGGLAALVEKLMQEEQ